MNNYDKSSRNIVTWILLTSLLILLVVFGVLSSLSRSDSTESKLSRAKYQPDNRISSGGAIDREAKPRHSHLHDKNYQIEEFTIPYETDPEKIIFVLADDGSLTSSAIETLDIKREEIPILQDLINFSFKKFESLLAESAVYIESESDPAEQRFTYQIPASKVARNKILSSLKKGILDQFGESKGNSIFSAFLMDPGNLQRLAGLGRYDTKIQFHPNETGDVNIVTYYYTDPDSGSRIRTSITTIESFKEAFGATFVFDHEK